MKRFTITFLLAILAIFLIAGSAAAVTIWDNLPNDQYGYIGGWPENSSFIGDDRIGLLNDFEITKMDVDFISGNMVMKIYSTYFDAASLGALNTELGDLFISNNGWDPADNPAGSSYPPTSHDYCSRPGQSWDGISFWRH